MTVNAKAPHHVYAEEVIDGLVTGLVHMNECEDYASAARWAFMMNKDNDDIEGRFPNTTFVVESTRLRLSTIAERIGKPA